MANLIQLRRGTAADWTTADPVLAAGEVGVETDTGQLKIGDGATAWTALGYFTSGGGSGANLTWTAASSTVASDTGTDAVLTEVDGSNPGLMSVADKGKLDAISGTNTGDEVAASSTTAGVVELATEAEVLDGTDPARVASVATSRAARFGDYRTGEAIVYPVVVDTGAAASLCADASEIVAHFTANVAAGWQVDETIGRVWGFADPGLDLDIELRPPESNELEFAGGDVTISHLATSGGSVEVTWPDASTSTVASGGSVSKTGMSAGVVSLVMLGAGRVTRFDSTVGVWTGDVSQFAGWPELTRMWITGANILSGDVSGVPAALVMFRVLGSNTISGDIADLPAGLSNGRVAGSNTLTGDVADLPSGLGVMSVFGSNTIFGDVADLPPGLALVEFEGSNTLTGDVADLPAVATIVIIRGSNTLTGDVADFPSAVATELVVTGSNTLTGDVADLPTGLVYLDIAGSSSLSYVSSSPILDAITRQCRIESGLSAAEVDRILIDLADAGKTPIIEKLIDLAGGGNEARTAASDAAVSTLTTATWTVQTA